MKRIKNFLLLLGVKAFSKYQKKNTLDKLRPKILILSTTGLGDTLWATPAFKEIKQYYPLAYIGVLTTTFGQEVLINNPYIDAYFTLPKFCSLHTIKLWKNLRKKRFQIVLHFHTSQRFVLPLSSLIGASEVIGLVKNTKGLDALLTRKFSIGNIHEIEKRLTLLQAIDIYSKISSPTYFLFKENPLSLQPFFPKKNRWILLHPGAKDTYKCWPFSQFIHLTKKYLADFSCTVFFSLGPEDVSLPLSQLPKEVIILQNLSLSSLANCMKYMDIIITNDTGPMHLSAALNCPTIGIFAPTDPQTSRAIADNVCTISAPKTCTPCLKRKCRDPFCLYQISPYKVFAQTKKMLGI